MRARVEVRCEDGVRVQGGAVAVEELVAASAKDGTLT